MSDLKNYSKCPLKKRPIMMANEDIDVLPEQEEPVDLCIKRVKCEVPEDVPQDFSVKRQQFPLKDITQSHQETLVYHNHTKEFLQPREKESFRPLYNLLPGYQYNQNETSPPPYGHNEIQIKQEVFSPYTREYSVSPPVVDVYHHASIKSSPYEDRYNHNKPINNYKPTDAYVTNAMPPRYNMPYPSRLHLVEEFHQMQPIPSPNSLNSLGSPRSSLSPASTGSLSEEMYHTISKQSPPLYDITNGHPVQYLEDKPELVVPSGSTVQRYQCTECGKSYSTYSGLTKHKQFHCPATEGNQAKKSFSCKYCEKVYISMGALKMHIRTHTLPCKCHICGKAFSRPWLLQGHIRTHTGEKPFSCQYCHRAFADRSNLRAHLQTHSDVKKYSCGSCSKTFSRMSLLTKHRDGGCAGDMNSSVQQSYVYGECN